MVMLMQQLRRHLVRSGEVISVVDSTSNWLSQKVAMLQRTPDCTSHITPGPAHHGHCGVRGKTLCTLHWRWWVKTRAVCSAAMWCNYKICFELPQPSSLTTERPYATTTAPPSMFSCIFITILIQVWLFSHHPAMQWMLITRPSSCTPSVIILCTQY